MEAQENRKPVNHYNEITSMKIILSENINGVTVRLVELESKGFDLEKTQQGMDYLLIAHNKLMENK